ncbi:uncharacterized protein LOC143292103 [Babylonia areolata]|uniref:uncharacterized protein LOC143292103 n=1 Tax=Babylonia areolata TaxID=304850 RepID=UPI003FD4DC98
MGLLLSAMARSGEIPWFYLSSLGQFECRRFFQCRQKVDANRFEPSDSNIPLSTTFESIGVQTTDPTFDNDSSPEKQPALLMAELNLPNTMTLRNGAENYPTERSQVSCDENSSERNMSESAPNNCQDVCVCTGTAACYQLMTEHGHQVWPGDQHHGSGADHRCAARVSSLSPVKEESDTDVSSEEEHAAHDPVMNETYPVFENQDPRLNETFPIFEDNVEVHRLAFSRHGEDLAKCRAHTVYRAKQYCSLSSDSGIGDALHGSSNASTSSVCISTSDSSDCSAHSYDLSSTGHMDDLEGCDGTVNDVFSHELSGGEDAQEYPPPETDHLGSGEPQKTAREQTTTPRRRANRPALAPLNFRARRKVRFSEEHSDEGHLDSPCPHHSSASSSPTSSVSSSSSSFLKSFRPLFSRQDSEESSSSVSSGDSILAVPLSPDSPASSDQPPAFVFPDPKAMTEHQHHQQQHCFSEPREGCDLVLVAEGQRFHVHSAVVAWQCSHLLQHLRDTGSGEVELPDRRAADVLCLLRLLYPFCRQPVTEGNVSAMVGLAHHLGCERVLRMCTTFLSGLAHLPRLCPHRHLPPSPPHHHHAASSRLHSSSLQEEGRSPSMLPEVSGADEKLECSRLCACADSMVERVLDILTLAAAYELDDVYATYLEVTAKVKAADITACPRFKHTSAVIRQDMLMARLGRLEHVVEHVELHEANLITCRHPRHQACHLTFSGPLCLKCTSRSLLHQAHSLG